MIFNLDYVKHVIYKSVLLFAAIPYNMFGSQPIAQGTAISSTINSMQPSYSAFTNITNAKHTFMTFENQENPANPYNLEKNIAYNKEKFEDTNKTRNRAKRDEIEAKISRLYDETTTIKEQTMTNIVEATDKNGESLSENNNHTTTEQPNTKDERATENNNEFFFENKNHATIEQPNTNIAKATDQTSKPISEDNNNAILTEQPNTNIVEATDQTSKPISEDNNNAILTEQSTTNKTETEEQTETSLGDSIVNKDEAKQIGLCISENKILCYENEGENMILNIDGEFNGKINLLTVCKTSNCQFENSTICLENVKTYFTNKHNPCQNPKCIKNTKNDLKDSDTELEIAQNLIGMDFVGLWDKTYNKFPIYISTSHNHVFGINIEKCDNIKIIEMNIGIQNFVNEIENQLDSSLNLNKALYSVIYKEMLFVQVNLELALLIVKNDVKGDVYTHAIHRSLTKMGHNPEKTITYKSDERYLKTICQNNTGHLKNNATLAIHELFYPYCLSRIGGIYPGYLNDSNIIDQKPVDYYQFIHYDRLKINDFHVYRFEMRKT